MSPVAPPRYVPTLTEVVRPTQDHDPLPPAVSLDQATIRDAIVQSAMGQIVPSLEVEINRITAELLQQQARALMPVISSALEHHVRQAVDAALLEAGVNATGRADQTS